ncbi:ComF family protein, partial [Streptomyces sp. JJ36]|uniref:ComF family protein n=1 Tax=Streptomyces sp. JJ36 TaxID=2736645 RepID=UPI0034D528F5|nr:ComF family protein [Streptomyces sp. JJ36]
MRGLWQELADLVLPGGCAGCGAERAPERLCAHCREALLRARPRRVRPDPPPPGLPAVHAALPYADQARAVLLAHKERGALRLAGPLGAVLARSVQAATAPLAAPPGTAPEGPGCRGAGPVGRPGGVAGARPLVLVPVPSARRATAARGH